MKLTTLIFVLILLIQNVSGFSLYYSFSSSKGDKWEEYWIIEDSVDHLILKTFDSGGGRYFISDYNGSIREFYYRDTNERIILYGKIKESDISLVSNENNKEKVRIVDTQEKYWYQPVGISFFDFILSSEEKRDFMFINPRNLSPVHMTITKMEREFIAIGGKQVEAIRAELRMTGFLAPFWVGNYWFSPESGIILQYNGDTGPGSAVIHMELTEIIGDLDKVTGFSN